VSDHAIVVVGLGVEEPPRAAARVREWLVRTGVVTHADDFSPGPRWGDAVEDPTDDAFLSLELNRVRVRADREMYAATDDDTPPECARCGRPYDAYWPLDWVDAWWDGGPEPVFTCAGCGWSAPVGDWPGEYVRTVGAPAVRFENWPPLTDAFVATLTGLLGGRTRVLYDHY
jgi:hypothetical protein